MNRGGGWGNHPRTLRVAKRDADAATGYGDAFGLRVARELPTPPPVIQIPREPASATEDTVPEAPPAEPATNAAPAEPNLIEPIAPESIAP